eukprot:298414-Chlamydomonas_euryale.AAC.3
MCGARRCGGGGKVLLCVGGGLGVAGEAGGLMTSCVVSWECIGEGMGHGNGRRRSNFVGSKCVGRGCPIGWVGGGGGRYASLRGVGHAHAV